MAAKSDTTTKLDVHRRDARHSRATRRLRREGRVPGVLYGRGGDPIPFDADERILRHALQASGAVLDISFDGGGAEPAVVKDVQRHPVRGELMHIDLLRVDLNKPIQSQVLIEFLGQDDAPGVREGGVMEHVTRELTVEALPNEIPEHIGVDVSGMNINDTVTVADIEAPPNTKICDDPETLVATCTPPRLEVEPSDEIESETEVVGEGAGRAEGEQASADEVPADAGGEGGE